MISRLRRGQAAEVRAQRWLEQQGLTLIERNLRCRLGELDLIMEQAQQVVIVEVRQRSSSDFGGAAGSVTRHKQRRIVAATRWWLSLHPERMQQAIRFDVLALQGPDQDIQWIQGAFDAE